MNGEKKSRGGARKGAGRKAANAGGKTARFVVSLDAHTSESLRAYGDGNLSSGIRRAAKTLADVEDHITPDDISARKIRPLASAS